MNQININNVKKFNVVLSESEIDFLLMGLQQAILYEDDSVDVILRLCDLFKRLQEIKDSK